MPSRTHGTKLGALKSGRDVPRECKTQVRVPASSRHGRRNSSGLMFCKLARCSAVQVVWGAITVWVCGYLGPTVVTIIHIPDIDAHFSGYVTLCWEFGNLDPTRRHPTRLKNGWISCFFTIAVFIVTWPLVCHQDYPSPALCQLHSRHHCQPRW